MITKPHQPPIPDNVVFSPIIVALPDPNISEDILYSEFANYEAERKHIGVSPPIPMHLKKLRDCDVTELKRWLNVDTVPKKITMVRRTLNKRKAARAGKKTAPMSRKTMTSLVSSISKALRASAPNRARKVRLGPP